MANVVIVAIPEENDYVWKISSEKVPHMTILSLGEQEIGPKTAKIASYLEFAADLMLHRFWMSVDRRGPLGPKEADVLFFDKAFCGEELKTFRDALLKSPDILDLYNDSPQFQEWTPHLTLGYPESPAHPDPRDYPGINGVHFDKLALWISDFDGPEVLLKGHDSSLAMADMGGPTPSVSNVAWSKYKKSDYSVAQWHAACLIHQHTGAPDSKSQCKLPVRTPDGTLNRKGVQAAAAALAGARGGVNATEDEIAKAKATLKTIYGQLGDDLPEVLTHSVSSSEELIAVIAQQKNVMPGDIMHHGVKGMKWGVRRGEPGSGGGPNVPPKVNRAAKKDAEEFTRAKLFYGEGAGNRRKLIKAKVEQKSKVSADYKKAFDYHVANTDLAKRASQATSQRRRKDVKKSVGRTTRGIKNVVTGNPQAATVAALGIVAGAKALKDSGIPQRAAAALAKLAQDRRNHQAVNDLLKNMGMKHSEGVLTDEEAAVIFLEHGLELDLGDDSLNVPFRMDHGLSHHGVKGMKWGVRKADSGGGGGGGQKTPPSKLRRTGRAAVSGADALLFAAGTRNEHVIRKVAVNASKALKEHDLPGIKAKHPSATLKTRLTKPLSPEAKAYRKDVKEAYIKRLEESANSMTNMRGTLRYTLSDHGKPNTSQYFWRLHVELIEHADGDASQNSDFSVRPVFDEDGYIVDIEYIDPLEQGVGVSDEDMLHALEDEDDLIGQLVEEGLELFHFGVKGMKWGVRRARGADGRVHGDASAEAKDKEQLLTKAKKGGGVHVLDNAELNRLNNRINLENNYSRLVAEKASLDKAHDTVKKTLKLGKTANEAVTFAKSPVGKALIAMAMGKGGKVAVNKLKG